MLASDLGRRFVWQPIRINIEKFPALVKDCIESEDFE